MSLNIQSVNVAIEITCLLLSVALLVSILIIKANRTKLTRIFLWMVVANSVVLLCDAIAWGFAGWPNPNMKPLLEAVNLMMYLMSYLQIALTAYYIVTYLAHRQTRVQKWILPCFLIGTCILAGMVIFSQFNGSVYYIDDNNFYRFGPLYELLYLITVAFAILFTVLILVYRKDFLGRELGAILFFILSLVAALILEAFVMEIMFVNAMTSVSLVVLFMLVHLQQETQAAEKEAKLKTSIMLSQIQPHFLYNTLNSISESLDEIEQASEANKALTTFAHYLRANMDSLTQQEPVPFEKELEHTKQYLWLEQFRFEERLQIEYDIQTTDFIIPVLTLQPLVENAVKHGVTEKRTGGTVKIWTEDTGDSFRVTVTDNGVGFDKDAILQGDGRSHMGLSNVRSRLAAMCGGTLFIKSIPGVGTTAVIDIPKKRGVGK